ncbi:MAG: ATP-binding cassette domain-containing protein [Bacteroidetes bacterium]|nr:ATP-binding cassette domain-containing protein [Bacteroidota bacterium]
MHSILTVKNVSKKYASHVALNNVSLDIPSNCIFGLLGPNGAGKTSLIRIINQITGPDSGEIYFNGEKLSPKHTAEIGYLPEERGLYKKMSVGEQALYLAQLKGLKKSDAKKQLIEWFKKFDIYSWWDKKVEELSKGMQQKVQFITTVLHKPKLLILDEPFSGFDPINANLIKSEILHLKKEGTTIIFSTHNMGSVEELCDSIALINKSEKILDGSVKEIRKTFKSNMYELKFTGSSLAFANALWSGAKILDQKNEDELTSVTLQLQSDLKINQILQLILPVVELHHVNEIVPSMNDIFIQKVSETKTVGTQSNFTE